jgi:hypothetical protein
MLFRSHESAAHHAVLQFCVMEKLVVHFVIDGTNIDSFFNTSQVSKKINLKNAKNKF